MRSCQLASAKNVLGAAEKNHSSCNSRGRGRLMVKVPFVLLELVSHNSLFSNQIQVDRNFAGSEF